jgi:hypothetical protein
MRHITTSDVPRVLEHDETVSSYFGWLEAHREGEAKDAALVGVDVMRDIRRGVDEFPGWTSLTSSPTRMVAWPDST